MIWAQTHVSGSRHQSAEAKRKSRELATREEIKKRLALSDCVRAKAPANSATNELRSTSKPLIEQARKAVLEVISGEVSRPVVKPSVPNLRMLRVGDDGGSSDLIGVVREVPPLDYRLRRERELKFTAAGWRRDGHGRWFKDENVSSFILPGFEFLLYFGTLFGFT